MDLSSAQIHCIIAYIVYNKIKRRISRKKRSTWVKPWIARRHIFGMHHALTQELRLEDPNSFRRLLRMDSTAFDHLVHLVTPLIERQNTNMRKCIAPDERLNITLRFLATG